MRAFQNIFDFNKNQIGFGNKYNNYGSEIVGAGSPGGAKPWYTPGKEDVKLHPTPPPPPPQNESHVIPDDDNTGTTNNTDHVDPSPPIDSDDVPSVPDKNDHTHTTIPGSTHDKNKDQGGSNNNIWILLAFLSVIILALLYLLYRKKKADNARMFKKTQELYDDEHRTGQKTKFLKNEDEVEQLDGSKEYEEGQAGFGINDSRSFDTGVNQ